MGFPRFIPFVVLLFFFPLFLSAGPDTNQAKNITVEDTVVKFQIQQKIGPSSWRKTKKAFNLVNKHDADYLLLHLNTYGGRVVEADSIKTRLLNSPVPVYVFIDPNAASAGALISIACSKIYMSPSATMGAATVVNQKGKKMPEKYQSYMRGTMRATAQSRGRDPKIAEAMVDEKIDLEGIAPKGELLTFTRKEAMENGYCEGKAKTIQDVIKKEGLKKAAIVEPEETFIDQIIMFLISPAVSSVLIMLILGGLYYELQSPGLGFPIAASIIAVILYFAPLYLENLAANWEIGVFILGVVLIGVEVFVIPGFGVPGISGLLLVLFSLVLSLIRNDFFDFTFTRSEDVVSALLTVSSSLVLFIVFVLVFGKPFFNSPLFKRLVLQDTLSNPSYEDTSSPSQSSTPENKQESETVRKSLEGRVAKAYTDLYPSGKIVLDDEMFDGVSEGEFIEKGQSVKVIKDKKNRLVVRPYD